MTREQSAMLTAAVLDVLDEQPAHPYRQPRPLFVFATGDRVVLRPGAPVIATKHGRIPLVGTGATVLDILGSHPEYGQRLRVRLDADDTERAMWAFGAEPEAVEAVA